MNKKVVGIHDLCHFIYKDKLMKGVWSLTMLKKLKRAACAIMTLCICISLVPSAQAASISNYGGTYGLCFNTRKTLTGWYNYSNTTILSYANEEFLNDYTNTDDGRTTDWVYADTIVLDPDKVTRTITLPFSIGKKTSTYNFDVTVSRPKNCSIFVQEGDCTTSLKQYSYTYGNTWDALVINNMELGDVIRVYCSFVGKSFYIKCDYYPSIEYDLKITDSENKDVTGKTIAVKPDGSTYTFDATYSDDRAGTANVTWAASGDSVEIVNDGSNPVTIRTTGTSGVTTLTATDSNHGDTASIKINPDWLTPKIVSHDYCQ